MTVTDTDDTLTAVRAGKDRYRWQWRAPWGAVHTGTSAHKTEAAALTAGRKRLREQQ